MATAAELLAPLRQGLVPVPAGGEQGVCRTCHSGCDPQFAQCYQCHEADKTIGVVEILPISMSIDREQLHHLLRNYKDGYDSAVRARMSLRLAALLAVFLGNHATCVGSFDSVVPVPSATRTAITAVLQFIPSLRDASRPALEMTGIGSKGDLRVDRFSASRDVAGERILVVDDTFTRGTTMFSAVATLRRAGATIVGPVVLGRHVQPNWGPSRELLSWLQPRPWDAERCCRCDGEREHPDRMPW